MRAAAPGADALLEVDGVAAIYGGAVEALRDVSLRVVRGEALAIVGANGAGKTTLARAISNLLPAERGRVTRGRISFDGHDISRRSPGDLVRLGLVPVLEGRHCFAAMTVEENLVTGAIARGSSRHRVRGDLCDVYDLFPRLAAKRRSFAGQISGGEQQMTAIGRALMAAPRLLILDEPSMGLAPLATSDIFTALNALRRERALTILLCEQNARLAQRHADRVTVLSNGKSIEVSDQGETYFEAAYFGEGVEPAVLADPEASGSNSPPKGRNVVEHARSRIV